MLVLIKVAEDSTQKERHTGEIWYDIPYPQSLNRNDTNELIYTHNLREWTYGYKGKGWGNG